VPGKNLREIGGVSLLARAVRSALASRSIDIVYVSTDDPAIAREALAHGARVIDRPAQLAVDTSTPESALLHALDSIAITDGVPDVLVFLQATSPFIDPRDVSAAIRRVCTGDEDVVFSVREASGLLWRATPSGARGVGHDGMFRPEPSEREPYYEETGAFYVMRTRGFRAARSRIFGRMGMAVVDGRRSIEIDNTGDLAFAEAIAPVLDRIALDRAPAGKAAFDKTTHTSAPLGRPLPGTPGLGVVASAAADRPGYSVGAR